MLNYASLCYIPLQDNNYFPNQLCETDSATGCLFQVHLITMLSMFFFSHNIYHLDYQFYYLLHFEFPIAVGIWQEKRRFCFSNGTCY